MSLSCRPPTTAAIAQAAEWVLRPGLTADDAVELCGEWLRQALFQKSEAPYPLRRESGNVIAD